MPSRPPAEPGTRVAQSAAQPSVRGRGGITMMLSLLVFVTMTIIIAATATGPEIRPSVDGGGLLPFAGLLLAVRGARALLNHARTQATPTRQWHRGKGVLERNQGSWNHAEQRKTRVLICRGVLRTHCPSFVALRGFAERSIWTRDASKSDGDCPCADQRARKLMLHGAACTSSRCN